MADNLALMKNGYEAFAKGDIQTVLALLDDKVEWNEAEHVTFWTGGPMIGPQAVLRDVFSRIPQEFDGFRIEIARMLSCGDSVLVQARYRGTAKATGKRLDAQVAHVWDLREGKIVRFQQYTDTWQFAQVTGVTPKS
ncbi:MAG: nuclear transport factor 2 family protein [Candidatus Rokubacteria bacterium]|nr:nuclear transport factor 2 family protein [Candidatus Rokubacteria bacterium]